MGNPTRPRDGRLRDHRLGRGARLVAAAVAAGATVELARTWRLPGAEAARAFERRLKQRCPSFSPRTRNGGRRRGANSSLRRLCPQPGCAGAGAWRRYPEASVRAPFLAELAARQARREHRAYCRELKAAGVWDEPPPWDAPPDQNGAAA
jgi:hypothetical protein